MGRKAMTWDRFWSHVNVGEGCWEWNLSIDPNGYAVTCIGNKKIHAHRVVAQVFQGEIPFNLCVDHLCRNRRCVRPDHLEVVSYSTNVQRGYDAVPQNVFCMRGHNDWKNTKNGRQCRVCQNDARRAWRKRTG